MPKTKRKPRATLRWITSSPAGPAHHVIHPGEVGLVILVSVGNLPPSVEMQIGVAVTEILQANGYIAGFEER